MSTERVNYGRKILSEYGDLIPYGGIPDLVQGNKAKKKKNLISVSWPPSDALSRQTLHSSYDELNPQNSGSKETFPPVHCLVQIFYHSNGSWINKIGLLSVLSLERMAAH